MLWLYLGGEAEVDYILANLGDNLQPIPHLTWEGLHITATSGVHLPIGASLQLTHQPTNQPRPEQVQVCVCRVVRRAASRVCSHQLGTAFHFPTHTRITSTATTFEIFLQLPSKYGFTIYAWYHMDDLSHALLSVGVQTTCPVPARTRDPKPDFPHHASRC
jgi:hypothetical protein